MTAPSSSNGSPGRTPHNVLLDAGTHEITAILDWEWGRPGGAAVADLARCEWIVRMHHPGAVGALDELFAGYGSRPPWPERQRAMLVTCHRMLNIRRTLGAADPGWARWYWAIVTTTTWAEL